MAVKYENFTKDFTMISSKNNVKLGTSQPKLYLGNTQVKATYLGNTLLIGSTIDSSYTLRLSLPCTENNISYVQQNTDYLAVTPYRDYFHYNEDFDRWELISYFYNEHFNYYEHPFVVWDDYSSDDLRGIYKNYCLSCDDLYYMNFKDTSALLNAELFVNNMVQYASDFNVNFTNITSASAAAYFFVEQTNDIPAKVLSVDYENYDLPLSFTYHYIITERPYKKTLKITSYDKHTVNNNAGGFSGFRTINFNKSNCFSFDLYTLTYIIPRVNLPGTLPPITNIVFSFLLPTIINYDIHVRIQYGSNQINNVYNVYTPSYNNIGSNWGFIVTINLDNTSQLIKDINNQNIESNTILNKLTFQFYESTGISFDEISLLNLSVTNKQHTGLYEFIITTE